MLAGSLGQEQGSKAPCWRGEKERASFPGQKNPLWEQGLRVQSREASLGRVFPSPGVPPCGKMLWLGCAAGGGRGAGPQTHRAGWRVLGGMSWGGLSPQLPLPRADARRFPKEQPSPPPWCWVQGAFSAHAAGTGVR